MATAAPLSRRFADLVALSALPAAARERPAPRVIDEMVIVSVEGGTGRCRQGAIVASVRQGSAFVIAPGEVHDVSGLWSARGWVIEFPAAVVGMAAEPRGDGRPDEAHPAWLSFIRPASLAGRLQLDADLARRWATRIRAAAADLRDRPVGYNQSIAAHLALMLIDAARIALPGLSGARRQAPLLQAVFDAIETGYAAGISLDGVATSIGISPAHLARVVKRTTGRTVNQWIAERRMVEARRRLLQTDEKVEAVARNAGFRDVSYFRRQFRAVHGASPAGWRRAHRGDDPSVEGDDLDDVAHDAARMRFSRGS